MGSELGESVDRTEADRTEVQRRPGGDDGWGGAEGGRTEADRSEVKRRPPGDDGWGKARGDRTEVDRLKMKRSPLRDDGSGKAEGDGRAHAPVDRERTGDEFAGLSLVGDESVVGKSGELREQTTSDLPVNGFEVDVRRSANRVDLVDEIPMESVAAYGGYVDVVIHGALDDPNTMISTVDNEPQCWSSKEVADLVSTHPGWDSRPIRLMSCNAAQGDAPQEIADELGVPVYAPDGLLNVRYDGFTFVRHEDDTPGSWKRFEPYSQ